MSHLILPKFCILSICSRIFAEYLYWIRWLHPPQHRVYLHTHANHTHKCITKCISLQFKHDRKCMLHATVHAWLIPLLWRFVELFMLEIFHSNPLFYTPTQPNWNSSQVNYHVRNIQYVTILVHIIRICTLFRLSCAYEYPVYSYVRILITIPYYKSA